MITNRPTIVDINCTTGEVIERQYTDEEMAQLEIDIMKGKEQEENHLAEKAALEALKASAKAKLVAGEPLTSEEAATIVL